MTKKQLFCKQWLTENKVSHTEEMVRYCDDLEGLRGFLRGLSSNDLNAFYLEIVGYSPTINDLDTQGDICIALSLEIAEMLDHWGANPARPQYIGGYLVYVRMAEKSSPNSPDAYTAVISNCGEPLGGVFHVGTYSETLDKVRNKINNY